MRGQPRVAKRGQRIGGDDGVIPFTDYDESGHA
jgi:hypothetical protein